MQRDDDLNEVALQLYKLQAEFISIRQELQRIIRLLASVITVVGLALEMINDAEK